MPLHLLRHPEPLSVVRLDGGSQPDWDWMRGPLASLSVSEEETSVICRTDLVPEGLTAQGPFLAFEVAGPLDFALVGVLHGLLGPLVARGISVFATSTYDTDYLLVPVERADEAQDALRKDGSIVTTPTLDNDDLTPGSDA